MIIYEEQPHETERRPEGLPDFETPSESGSAPGWPVARGERALFRLTWL